MTKRNLLNQAGHWQRIAGHFSTAAPDPQNSSDAAHVGRSQAPPTLAISAVIWRRRQTTATVGDWFQIKNDAR
jgi:hypothetical protein